MNEKQINTQNMKKKWLSWIEIVLAVLIYFTAIELISQIILLQTDELYTQYSSDLSAHIQIALKGGGYSLTAWVYQVLDSIFHNQISIAIFLICLIFSGVYAASWYLKKMIRSDNWPLCLAAGLFAYCSAAIYLPSINAYRYLGLQMSGVWHNSTLFGIKLLGVVQLYLFQKIAVRFQKEHNISPGELVGFSLAGLLSAWIKPNLDLALYPALAVMLVIWFVQGRGKWLKPLSAIACTVIPTFAVLLWQSSVLFGSDALSSFAISPFYIISKWVSNIPVAIIQSIAFPGAVLLLGWKSLKKMDGYCFVWLSTIIAYIQCLFLVEPGSRIENGNWYWGVLAAVFLLFLVSIVYLTSHTKAIWAQGGWKKYWLVACYGLFLLHAWFGYEYLVYYFTTGTYT